VVAITVGKLLQPPLGTTITRSHTASYYSWLAGVIFHLPFFFIVLLCNWGSV
jgi:hypothetical protein